MTISNGALTVQRYGTSHLIQRITDADRARALARMGYGPWVAAGLVKGLLMLKEVA